jgi:pimeloyl-ACP methyl ester carboxylesterase
MRRVARAAYLGAEPGDLSALENPAAVQAIAAAGRSRRGFHSRDVNFEGPVAALWGARDALVPLDHTKAVRRALPQTHLEIWPRMGHHPQRERPAQLARFIELHAAREHAPAQRATRRSSARRG